MTDILILERARVALTEQNNWHLSQTEECEHGFVLADEYQDSSLCEKTMNSIAELEAEIHRRTGK